MKKNNILMIFSFILLTLVGCKSEEFSTIKAEGEYAVNFSLPEGNIYAPAKLILTNRSKYADAFQWSFPEAKTINKDGEVVEETSSRKVVPDTIFYRNPGEYEITLVAHQGGKSETMTKKFNVLKMQPQIGHPETMAKEEEIEFTATSFEYEDQQTTYNWTFSGIDVTSTEKNPKITFAEGGYYTVTLTVNDGVETLTTVKEILVLGESVKTLYFTDAITKKVYKYKFTTLTPRMVEPTGISHGIHPLSMYVFNGRIYMSETGLGINFSTALADGKITSVAINGTNEITHTSTPTNKAYGDDPFNMTIDEATSTILYTNRFGGVFSIPTSSNEAVYPTTARLTVTAAQNNGNSVFGWLDGGLQVIDGVLWYSKHGSAGKGMFKYTLSDNKISEIPAALRDLKMRSFQVDTKNGKIYFAINFQSGAYGKGFYQANIDGSNIVLLDAMPNFSDQGGNNEQTYVTSIVIDDEVTTDSPGYVYWAYRDNSDVTGNAPVISGRGANSGIKRYALDGSKPVEFLLKGYAPYGMAIDHIKR
jgi:PKD repeat protein